MFDTEFKSSDSTFFTEFEAGTLAVLEPATTEKLGGVIIGENLLVTPNGKVSVDISEEVTSEGTKPISSKAVKNYVDIFEDEIRREIEAGAFIGPEGPQGPKGDKGDDGAPGPQGIPGIQGPKGDKGEDGAQGPQGERGADGAPGPKGEDGLPGPEGPQGPKGDKGEDGAPGPQGPKGEDGAPGPEGPQGPKGDKGDTGAPGPEGPQGPKGEDGTVGPEGPQGPKGDPFTYSDFTPEQLESLKVKGDKGDDGATGPEGPQGPQGPKGDKGDDGARGPKGDSGYSPIKGVDYWTSDDKEEIVNEVKYDVALSKFPNVVIIGQPTINYGQISHFTVNDYCRFPFEVNFANRPFDIRFYFTTSSDVISQQNILDSYFGLAFAVRNSRFVMAVSTNGTSWDLGEIVGTHTVSPDTAYLVSISWDGSMYSISVSTDGGESWIVDATRSSTSYPYPKVMYIGRGADGTHIFGGMVDLDQAALYVSDKLVWQGMDDVGLATRLALDLSNIDSAGEERIIEISSKNGMPTGTIIPFAGNGDIPVGFLLCNGASVARETYPDLFAVIGTTYGAADDDHFNLPDLRDKFIEGGEIGGEYKSAGLPNITGAKYMGWDNSGADTVLLGGAGYAEPAGSALYATKDITRSNTTYYASGSKNQVVPDHYPTLAFDASRSDSIYGNSDTVQPPALTVRYIIKAFAGASENSTDLEITRVANDLNDKLSLSGGILRGDVVFMDDGEYDIKWLKFKSPNGSNVFAIGYQGLNNEVWLAKLTPDETAIDKRIARINLNTNQVWFEETFNTTEILCVGRDGVLPYLRLVKDTDYNYIQLLNASDNWIADLFKISNSGSDGGSFFMPKAGGTFSGGVVANNANRSGYYVRNFWVGNASSQVQPTGYIWAKRK